MESEAWKPKIEVASKKLIEKTRVNVPYALISMSGEEEKFPRPKIKPYLWLKLFFNDVEDINRCYNPPSTKDIDRILSFIEECKKIQIPLIICQCYAGISRSAAVAIGICNYLQLDSSEFYNESKYLPNRLILRLFAEVNNGSL